MGNQPTDSDPKRRDAEGIESKGPQNPDVPPEVPGNIVVPTLTQSTGDRAQEEVSDSAERFNALPYERQALAYLGFRNAESPMEIRGLPGNCRIVTVTVPITEIARLDRLLYTTDLTRPLTPGIRNPQNPYVTSQHLVLHPNNTDALLEVAEGDNLPIDIRSTSDNTNVAVRLRDSVMAVDPSMFEEIPEGSDDPTRPQVLTLTTSVTEGTKVRYISKASRFPRERKRGPISKWNDSAHSSASRNSIELARQLPRETQEVVFGGCTYLAIDLNLLARDTQHQRHILYILNQIAALAASDDFIFRSDNAGNLVIIALSQRSGGFLEKLAKTMHTATNKNANMLIGSGELKQDVSGHLVMDGFANPTLQRLWKDVGLERPRATIVAKDHEKFEAGRDSTVAHAKVATIEGTDQLLEITDVETEAKFKIGGPDRLIGYKEELDNLRKTVSATSRTKLIVLKGRAGRGKSRLLEELAAEQTNMVKISIDPAGEKIQGYSLVNFAEQLSRAIETHLPQGLQVKHGRVLSPLKEFVTKSEAAKIRTAQVAPREITSMCFNALKILETCQGSFTLVVDDTHHIDRHSDEHLMKLVRDLLRESQSKAVLALRPEERYKSQAQRTLEMEIRSFAGRTHHAEIEKNPISEIFLEDPDTGEAKLNLHDPKTSCDYVFYSLPEAIRVNPVSKRPRKLIDFHNFLAERSETPWDLTSLINIILRNPEANLIVGDETIELHPKAEKEISKIRNSRDLAIYHRERVRRLKKNHRTLLQCMALLGNRVTFNQLLELARDIASIPNPGETINGLERDGYVIIEGKEERNAAVRIQHENFRDIVLQAMPPNDRKRLAVQLYNKTQRDEGVHNDTLFALLCEVAPQRHVKDMGFWAQYALRAEIALKEAGTQKAYGRAYGTAMTVLDGLEPDSKSKLLQALQRLKDGDAKEHANISERVQKLLADCLLAVIENGVYIGRFSKVHEAVTALEKIGAENYLLKAYLAGFKAAYVQIDRKKLEEYAQKILRRRDVPESTRVSIEIHLSFKKSKTAAECAESLRLYDTFASELKAMGPRQEDQKTFLELQRLRQRIIFEQTHLRILDSGVDGDVVIEPGHLTVTETANMSQSLARLQNLDRIRRSTPGHFGATEELYLLDQLANTQGYFGNYPEAVRTFSEVWRLATQMEIPREAARAAKIKGDIEIMEAVAQIEFPTEGRRGRTTPKKVIDRAKVLKAIHTYTEEGLASLKQVDREEYYQILLRCQRMRAVSILIASYQNEIKAMLDAQSIQECDRIKAELSPYLKNAIEDFEFINASPKWAPALVSEAGEFPYYITSSIGHVLHCVDQLNFRPNEIGTDIPDMLDVQKYKGFLPGAIFAAMRFTERKKPHDNVGEVDRKLVGIGKIIDLGKRRAQAQIAIDVRMRDRAISFENLQGSLRRVQGGRS